MKKITKFKRTTRCDYCGDLLRLTASHVNDDGIPVKQYECLKCGRSVFCEMNNRYSKQDAKQAKHTKDWIDYKALKKQVSMRDILNHYGLLAELKAREENELTGFCPIHDIDQYAKNAFSVNTRKNIWHCFSCGQGGNIIDFVMAKEGVDIKKAAQLIAEWFLNASQSSQKPLKQAKREEPREVTGEEQKAADTRDKEEPNKPLSFTLKNLDQSHPYLKDRGLSEETIKTFGLGYCDKGIMKGRVVIPIHNVGSQLVAYAGRWPGEPPDNESKYKLPPGFKKHLEVFNLHRAIKDAEGSQDKPISPCLIIVEGFFDCMKIWQAGYRNVVAVMGAELFPEQAQLIIDTLNLNAIGGNARIITMFDGDEAGYRGAFKALAYFLHKMFIKEIRLEQGQQPDSLPTAQIKKLLL